MNHWAGVWRDMTASSTVCNGFSGPAGGFYVEIRLIVVAYLCVAFTRDTSWLLGRLCTDYQIFTMPYIDSKVDHFPSYNR